MNKGFTLIELMIVIAIVAILAAIAIPNFTKLKEQAAVNAAYASIQNLRKAIEAYKSMNDYGGVPQDFPALKDAIGQRGEKLFLFDLNEMRADMKKLAYGASGGTYTLAALALDNDDTCVWINDKNSKKGRTKDCFDKPDPSSGLTQWDLDLTQ